MAQNKRTKFKVSSAWTENHILLRASMSSGFYRTLGLGNHNLTYLCFKMEYPSAVRVLVSQIALCLRYKKSNKMQFHIAFVFIGSSVLLRHSSNVLLSTAIFSTTWTAVHLLCWNPVIWPLLTDLFHNPLSSLAELTVFLWLLYFYRGLPDQLIETHGVLGSLFWASISMVGLRVLLLVSGATRKQPNTRVRRSGRTPRRV